MAKLKRGFRRIAWLLVLLAAPAFMILALGLSEHHVGWRPELISKNYPNLGRFEQPSTIVVRDMAVAYFPTYLSKEEATRAAETLFDPKRHPELFARVPGKDPLGRRKHTLPHHHPTSEVL